MAQESPLPGPEWNRFAEQLRGIGETNRKAVEALRTSGLLSTQQAIADSFAGLASTSALREKLRTPELRALKKQMAEIDRSFGTVAQQNAIARSLTRMTDALDASAWAKVGDYAKSIPVETVADPETAIAQVAEQVGLDVELETPSGVTAFPLAVARLSPSRRRELKFRLLSLLVATCALLEALNLDQNENALAGNVLVQCYGLYASLLSAVEETKQEPSDQKSR